MPGTFGHMCGAPFARWDRASSSWRTSEGTCLWDLEMSLPTLPTWGCLRAGELSKHPMSERHIGGPGCSSSRGLPSQRATDANGAGLHGDGGMDLRTAVAFMLPTPTSRDHKGSDLPSREGAPSLPQLLATPSVMDMGSSYEPEEWLEWRKEKKAKHRNGNGHGESLTQQLIGVSTPTQSQDGAESSVGPRHRQLSLGRQGESD